MNNTVVKIEEFIDSSPDLEITLGISPTIFRDAMQSGISLYKSTTSFHPLTAGGSRAWEEIVATFRSQIIEQNDGWQAIQKIGMPVVINSDRSLTIVITSGDENTGVNNSTEPKTKNAKGQVTESYVGHNYDLFDDSNFYLDNTPIDGHKTWVLLYTLDKVRSEVRYELSLPTSTAISGSNGKIKICSWQTRVIFPAISFNEIMIPEPNIEFTDDSDFFKVEKK